MADYTALCLALSKIISYQHANRRATDFAVPVFKVLVAQAAKDSGLA